MLWNADRRTAGRVFQPAGVIEETLGNLSAFYAMFPGNGKFNVFPLWLSEDHHARLSSVFAPHLGHPHSEDLDAEYLNIFETRTRTPFFQDVYVDGVRVMLILGPTGTGKSVHGNQLIALEQKYCGFSYIFDIGGSYESVVELYGALSPEGHVSIHLDNGRKVSLNPQQMRHLDHGYAVTSHSSQGLTADRVLVHVDTGVHPELVSDRFAYVSISRASQDATLYTNSLERLGELVSRSHGKSSALETPLKISAKPQLINHLASGQGLAV